MHVEMLSSFVDRIRSAHPSIRPRMDTPKVIGPKPPAPKPPAPPPPSEEVGGQEMYVECEPVPEPEQPEDYLPFEPSQRVNGDTPQELYEEMNPTDDVQAEVYEEPGMWVLTSGVAVRGGFNMSSGTLPLPSYILEIIM